MTSGTRITVDGRSQWNDSVSAVLGIVVPPTAADAPLHADLSAHSVGDIRLIDITTSRMSAITSAPPAAAPPRYWFGVQVAGSCRLVRGDSSFELERGDAVFHTADVASQFEVTSDFRGIALVAPQWAVPISPRRLADRPIATLRAGSGLVDVFRALLESLNRAMPSISASEAARALWAALDIAVTLFAGDHELGQVDADHARRVRLAQLKAYVLANLADPDLTVARVAAANYMSPRTIQAIFASEGESVAAWIRARRMERACRELTDPALAHLTVTAVSARVGYRSPSHFGQVFVATLGMTPHAYRSAVARGTWPET